MWARRRGGRPGRSRRGGGPCFRSGATLYLLDEYLLDEFNFHMTLSNTLDAGELRALRRALAPLTAPHCAAPLAVSGIALFEQAAHDAPFMLASRHPFAA